MTPGQIIDVERLVANEGDKVSLEQVLLIADGDNITVGNPVINGAKVVATSKGEFKGDKIIVFKYKPKTRYHKKTGHRQFHTKLAIDEIIEPGAEKAAPKRKKKEVTADGA